MKIRTLPYPKVPHKDLVAKELHQRKPFRDSKKGYRDALIWETVKEELIPSKNLFDECQILFLTENTRDLRMVILFILIWFRNYWILDLRKM